MTTPLEREVLSHYYVSPDPFPRWTPFISLLVRRFIRAGLLTELDLPNHKGSWVQGNQAALKPYMDALAAVSLPRQVWSVPDGRV